MKAQSTGPILSTIFVDYDNIYLSLKRKSDEAAKRFAKDAASWLKELETGRLIRATNGPAPSAPRRIVMNRCYGNPVPRRNASDNSTDMNSFPFVRHHFLRAGFEVVDCPPLTAQLKNSADIRMVMDIRDLLHHETRFDEFIILSSDADFTSLLHRLRAHARRTVVFANDHTAAPYTAICDGEVREADLVTLLLEGRIGSDAEPNSVAEPLVPVASVQLEAARKEILLEVVSSVRMAGQPVPLEALADRAVRTLGHEKTVGSGWGGTGSFRDLLLKGLPDEVRLTEQPPYYVYDTSRQLAAEPATTLRREPRQPEPRAELAGRPTREPRSEALAQTTFAAPPAPPAPSLSAQAPAAAQARPTPPQAPHHPDTGLYATAPAARPARSGAGHETLAVAAPRAPQSAPTATRSAEASTAMQQSIARIHEACQAPPLSPMEYRVLFEVMSAEITANNLAGSQTLANVVQRARDHGIEVSRDDVRFVLEVVSEPDPWFDQGASAALFASRFRNFVVARCRSHGLALSTDELDLIEAWFGGSTVQRAALPPAHGREAQATSSGRPAASPPPVQSPTAPPAQPSYAPASGAAQADRWWSLEEGRQHVAETRSADAFGAPDGDEFPRIVRTRLRG